MITFRLFVVAGLIPLSLVPAQCGELTLAEGGKSEYRIVVADDASPSTRHAAEELQTFLKEISGATLPIVSDQQPSLEREIILGDNVHLKMLSPPVDLSGLGAEGYVIRTAGHRLAIAGGALRGNLYGVYGLLEDHLGCRWFAPGVSRIPKQPRLALPEINDRRVPVLEYREPFTSDCFDGDWCARNRVNSSAGRLAAKHGGKIRFGNGFFVHTLERLVPPSTYFDAHPEYFSLVKGKRLKERSQLCCTNEEVIRLCTEGILKAMRADPEAFVFSVSQNDWGNYCECETCQALAQKEDSQIAPVLALVNRVADSVSKEFPDKAVETLAYQWTRRPPLSMRPRPNVIVRLCSIECCFSHPLATCDSKANQQFREDAQRWAKVSQRLWVWDYVTDFAHYLLPFPNQKVRGENIRFFIKNNVRGIFEQDTYNTGHSELACLGGYMTAKLLWNPDRDTDALINEFLDGYYGPAAGPIRSYIDLLHDKAQRENIHVSIWAQPSSPHLSDDLLLAADEFWQQAQSRAAELPEIHRRVQLGRMSVDYAIVECARLKMQKRQGDSRLVSLARQRLDPFLATLKASGMTRLRENKELDLPDYRNQLTIALQVEQK